MGANLKAVGIPACRQAGMPMLREMVGSSWFASCESAMRNYDEKDMGL
jgi:hypothetical protein